MASLVVELTKEDLTRLGKRRVRLHVIQPRVIDMLAAAIDGCSLVPVLSTQQLAVRSGPLRRNRWDYEACVYLRGVPLKNTRCAVYEDRPSVCRGFKPGGAGCLATRRLYDAQ